jgi:hypothetical protein
VVNKSLDIHDLILEKELDVLCLTETWLKEAGDEPVIGELVPPSYTFTHRVRRTGQRGGGVGIVYRRDFKVQVCKERVFSSFDIVELCLSRGKQSVHIACIYRPPPSKTNKLTSQDFFREFGTYLNALDAKNILIVGDLNFHLDCQNPDTKRFMELVNSCEFEQLVTLPTHNRGHILDVVLVRSPRLVRSVSVENLYMSDHFLVLTETDFSRPRAERVVVRSRDMRGIDRSKFESDLLASPLFNSPPDDVDSLVDLYNTVLRDLLDDHAPEKERVVPNRPSSPWLNEEILSARRARRCAERKMRKTGLTVDADIYRRARLTATRAISKAKAAYFQSQLEDASSDPKKMFSLLQSLMNRQDCSDVLPDLTDQEIADSLSNFFQEKIDKIRLGFSSDAPRDASSSSDTSAVNFSTFSPLVSGDIRKLILKAKPTTSALDPAPTKFVLEFLEILLPVFERMINLSLSSGIVPRSFKTASVIPLLKKPGLDPDVLGNYRPVSNLPFASKLLERAVAEQLNEHLKRHDMYARFQSAYRPSHSTETALVRVVNDLLSFVDSGENALLVCLDLSAAFDTIDHALLLGRLSDVVRLSDTVLSWFSSYLSDRFQRVLVNQCFSAETPLLCGVPQGSVLGPVLFSLYTKPLSELISSFSVDHHFFADDSELYSKIPVEPNAALAAIQNIEQCCLAIKSWMNTNKLKLNDQKTEALLCGPPQRRESCPRQCIQVGGATIPFASSVKSLGVVLDSDLSFDAHISFVVKTCFFHVRALSKIRNYITRPSANTVAVSLVLSRLDYCNSLLAGLPQTQIKRLQAAQNAAARVVTGSRRSDHITPILRELHWLPVCDRIKHKVLSLTFNAVKDSQPAYMADLVRCYQPSRALRSADSSLLVVPGLREIKTKRFGQRSFRYFASVAWNELPRDIRETTSISSFKSSLKTYLFSL